jgi:hypothetical protein
MRLHEDDGLYVERATAEENIGTSEIIGKALHCCRTSELLYNHPLGTIITLYIGLHMIIDVTFTNRWFSNATSKNKFMSNNRFFYRFKILLARRQMSRSSGLTSGKHGQLSGSSELRQTSRWVQTHPHGLVVRTDGTSENSGSQHLCYV